MKCVICHSEDIQKRSIEEEVKSGKDIVLFKVEALVCNSCGERYYDPQTVKKIEELRDKIKGKQVDVEKVGEVYRTRSA